MLSRFILFVLLALPLPIRADDGFAGAVTGGAGGRTLTVRTGEELLKSAALEEPLTIRVEGRITCGIINVRSNKTIVGIGKTATIEGSLYLTDWASNVLIRNLNFTNPVEKEGHDGITVGPSKKVWIDHCSFSDCGDGAIDMYAGADWVTVSWCKFSYTEKAVHRRTMLALGRDDKKKKKTSTLHVTLHHNWFAERCDQRMPATRRANVHVYNCYFSCTGNSYCTNPREKAELLGENNYYDRVHKPVVGEDGAKLQIRGNVYHQCTGTITPGKDTVFKPPYSYQLDRTEDVPRFVKAGAGVQ